MADVFSCFACHTVAPLDEGAERKCRLCGSTDGEILSPERLKQGMEAGVYFNIDLKTGKRAKKTRRR